LSGGFEPQKVFFGLMDVRMIVSLSITPFRSAESIMLNPILSLTLEQWLKDSSFAIRVVGSPPTDS